MKLRDFTDGLDRDPRAGELAHLFRRFLRDNESDGPPYFCISASIMGRVVHTFKEEYISKDKKRTASLEL